MKSDSHDKPIQSVLTGLWLSSFLFLLLAPSPAFTQPAILENNILRLPRVEVGIFFFSAEFSVDSTVDPPRLVLLTVGEPTGNPELTFSRFRGSVLFIPDIQYQGGLWWAGFQLEEGNRLRLLYFGVHRAIDSLNQVGLTRQPEWVRLEGDGRDIGVGNDGSVWLLGNDPRPGGYGIYRWQADSWQRFPGAGVRIDVAPDGTPWIINDEREIFRLENDTWVRVGGSALDIGIGADDSVWVTTQDGVYRWLGNNEWSRTRGSGLRIDVDPDGHPWVVNEEEEIYQLLNDNWVRRPGSARDIGIGGDGSVWVVGADDGEGNFRIFRWNGMTWNRVQGGARRISSGPDGAPWVVSSDGHVYRGD